MPKFVNTNAHRIYVDDPSDEERDLSRVLPGEEISATGAYADNLSAVAGVVEAGSDEAKEREEKQELLEAPGPEAFPAVDVDGESKSKRKPKAKPKSGKPTGTVTTGDAPAK